MGPELGVLVADAAMLEKALEIVRNVDEAQLFLMDDGVRAAGEPRLLAAIDDGLEATVCAMDAEARGVKAVVGGPRFGSQWDHAVMVRDAAEVVALTGFDGKTNRQQATGNRQQAMAERHVAVRVMRAEKAGSALRSAVGYVGVGLRVTIVVEAVVDAAAHQKAIGTLRGMGARFVDAPVACDVEVCW